MNILNGLRLANRQILTGELAASQAALEVVGTAYSVLSIKKAITNTQEIKEEKALSELMYKIRKTAFKLIDNAKQVELRITAQEHNELEGLKDGAKTILSKGLDHVGKWFIKGIYMGARYVIAPVFRIVSFVASNALRLLLTNPVILGVVAAASAGYLLYRAFFKEKTPETPRDMITPGGAKTTSVPLGKNAKGAVEVGDNYQVPKASTATAAPTEVFDTKGRKRDNVPFGIRNNNPGNIEFHNQEGATRYSPKGDGKGRFAIFPSQEEGLYQIARQLQLYDKRGVSTIKGMITRYAPPSKDGKIENDTQNYINWVSSQAGVPPDDKVDMTNERVVIALVKAIVRMEVGNAPYTDAQYLEAVKRSVVFRGLGFADQVNKKAFTADDNYTAEANGKAPYSPDTKAYTGGESQVDKAGNPLKMQTPTYGTVTSLRGTRVHPVTGITRMHKGIDIGAPTGTPVYAAHDGRATTGTVGGYGNLLRLVGDRYQTWYAHLSSFGVKSGQVVKRGQVIAKVGNTGIGTGAHLHFEVRDLKGNDLDLEPFIAFPMRKGHKLAKDDVASASSVVQPSAAIVPKETMIIKSGKKLIKLEK